MWRGGKKGGFDSGQMRREWPTAGWYLCGGVSLENAEQSNVLHVQCTIGRKRSPLRRSCLPRSLWNTSLHTFLQPSCFHHSIVGLMLSSRAVEKEKILRYADI